MTLSLRKLEASEARPCCRYLLDEEVTFIASTQRSLRNHAERSECARGIKFKIRYDCAWTVSLGLQNLLKVYVKQLGRAETAVSPSDQTHTQLLLRKPVQESEQRSAQLHLVPNRDSKSKNIGSGLSGDLFGAITPNWDLMQQIVELTSQ